MKVITKSPVILNGTNLSNDDLYSNAPGDGVTPSLDLQASAQKKGQFWNKAKGAWEKITNSPAANFALQQVAAYQAQKQLGANMSPDASAVTPPAPTAPTEEKMGKGMKIALGIGAVVVVGLIIYAIMAKDKKAN